MQDAIEAMMPYIQKQFACGTCCTPLRGISSAHFTPSPAHAPSDVILPNKVRGRGVTLTYYGMR